MADNTLKVRLQSAYKTSVDWDTLNPVLKNGEVGYVSSPASMYGWYKIGNGTSTWNQLPYSTYRPLNNGDFDTINVTDETAGNLIVTGAARFTNVIQGTASSASNAAKVDGTLTITQDGTTKLNAWNGSAATSITLTDNNDTYKFATSTSGITTAIAGLKANGASTFDTSSSANLATTAFVNPLINALGTGSSQMTTADYLITSYVGAGTPTTTWHRRQAKFVAVGYASSAGAAPYPVTGADRGLDVVSKKVGHVTSLTASANISGTANVSGWGQVATVAVPSIDAYGHTTACKTKTITMPSSTGLATEAYVNERVANAVHFKGGFNANNADALKTPLKEIGDMYLVSTAGTFYGLELEVGDSIIFQSTVAAGTNPTSADFIGVEKTVSVENNGPTLSWGNTSTVGAVEGVNLTVKMPANPNTDEKLKMTPASVTKFYPAGNPNSTSAVTTAYYSTAVSITGATVSGGTFSGNKIHANIANSGSDGGVALYSTVVSDYGVAMRQTANSGKHGGVQGDWAIYNWMAGATNRGFIWKNSSTAVASIDCAGNEVLNGSLTVGGSSANNTGCKMQYNSTTKSLDFVFA